ncbi:MAG: 4Fe-4S dicluster domain-containing protein [Thermoanaerobaculaceae bacterium]|jgi:protein NrfC|nr:4Fe-4S dicluster domain-containing protein [Thermoanaerobaculaceae bacterium]
MAENDTTTPGAVTRRRFLRDTSLAGCAVAAGAQVLLADGTLVIPASQGFLLVDLKKCQGCSTCMMACALAHTGTASYTLARIQIQQDSFARFPDDVFMATCRQCADAPCVRVCPTGANAPDPAFGNVRRIDPAKCIGCRSCVARCPYTPARLQWDHARQVALKCDLCADTPHLGSRGGPGGVQTCVRVCPEKAISFTATMPDQKDLHSYEVNLRDRAWAKLGMSVK